MEKRQYDKSRYNGGDTGNLILLFTLYAFQGVPLGLSLGSLNYIMKKSLTYTELGFFALASYPFSLKFLWSPLVDTKYVASIGRRKTWVVSF